MKKVKKLKIEPNPKAKIYCRVSTEKQANKGHSLETQDQILQAVAQERGYRYDKTYKDGGWSGTLLNRPGITSLLEDLRKETAQCVVLMYDVTRAARDVDVYSFLTSEIKKMGHRYEYNDFIPSERPQDKFMEGVGVLQGQYTRDIGKQKTTETMQRLFKEGYYQFPPPFGYICAKQSPSGLITPDPDVKPIIKEVFEGYLYGRFLKYVDIKRFLESHPVIQQKQTQYKKKYGVNKNTPERILKCMVYAGIIECEDWGTGIVKAKHEAIIDEETFFQVQDKVAGRIPSNLRIREKSQLNDMFPLRGFIHCEACGRKLTGAIHKKKYPHYFCYNKPCNCELSNKNVRKGDIEEQFLSMLEGIKPNKQLLTMIKETCMQAHKKWIEYYTKNQKFLAAQAESKNQEKRALIKRITDTKNTTLINSYEQELITLETEIAELQNHINDEPGLDLIPQLGTVIDEVLSIMSKPRELWLSGDIGQREAVFRSVFKGNLTYHAQNGFGTVERSQIYKLFDAIANDEVQMVAHIADNWNSIMAEFARVYEIIASAGILNKTANSNVNLRTLGNTYKLLTARA